MARFEVRGYWWDSGLIQRIECRTVIVALGAIHPCGVVGNRLFSGGHIHVNIAVYGLYAHIGLYGSNAKVATSDAPEHD